MVRANVTQCSAYLTIARALMQKHSFQGGSGSFVFNAVRAGAYWHKICGIYVYAFAEQNFQTGEHGQFRPFCKGYRKAKWPKDGRVRRRTSKGPKTYMSYNSHDDKRQGSSSSERNIYIFLTNIEKALLFLVTISLHFA